LPISQVMSDNEVENVTDLLNHFNID